MNWERLKYYKINGFLKFEKKLMLRKIRIEENVNT